MGEEIFCSDGFICFREKFETRSVELSRYEVVDANTPKEKMGIIKDMFYLVPLHWWTSQHLKQQGLDENP